MRPAPWLRGLIPLTFISLSIQLIPMGLYYSFITAALLLVLAFSCPALAACPCNDAVAGDSGIAGQVTPVLAEVASRIAASRTISGVVKDVAPRIASVGNKTVYELNSTDMITISKGIPARISPVLSEMEAVIVNGTSLIVRNASNPAVNIQMILRRENRTVEKNMTVTRTVNARLNVTMGNATVFTDSGIIYENDTLYISSLNRTVELKTLPDEARERVRERLRSGAEVREMFLEFREEAVKYRIMTTTRKRILGLFDADVEEDSVLDADSGEIESTTGPWWGFLAW